MARNRRRGRSDRNPAGQRRVYIVGAAGALFVVLALVLLGALSRGNGEIGDAVILPSPRTTDIPRDGLLLGDSAAPVSLIEYADFQ